MKRYEKGLIKNIIDECEKENGKIKKTIKGAKEFRTATFELPIAFDIETSSLYYDPKSLECYRTDDFTRPHRITKNNERIELCEKVAFMYIWQMSIDRTAFYGRTWEEWLEALEELRQRLGKKGRIVIYIHNAAYEFQFIRKLFTWKEIFALDNRKPAFAVTSTDIEFRCSYMESGLSLAKISEDLETKKLVGDLDYKLIRHEETKLSEEELKYCENDVLVLTEYVKKKMAQRGSITNILMTKTAYVREYCRNYCLQNYSYKQKIKNLTITEKEYYLNKAAFQGGFAHASFLNTGIEFENVVSHDITSSYPTAMCSELFPASTGKEIELKSKKQFEDLVRKKLCIFEIEIFGLESTTCIEHILSKSRCFVMRDGEKVSVCEDAVEDNGRLIAASHLITTITNIDYFELQKFYCWKNFRIKNFIYYEPAYLPKRLIECVIHFYKMKTELKDIEGKEVEYAYYKSMLNSIFGMMVMDIIREKFEYHEDWQNSQDEAKTTIEKYNNNRSRFLFYPWGVFLTAYARRNLFKAIIDLKSDYIYSDTDSVKFINSKLHEDFFKKYNEEIDKKIKRCCEHYKINFEDTRPKDIFGKEHSLGHFDKEYDATRFKTIGAKRYMCEIEKKGKREIKTTIAGIGKKSGSDFLSSFENPFESFNENLEIPADKTNKQICTYIDTGRQYYFITDYQGNKKAIHNPFPSIFMEDASFNLKMSSEYEKILNTSQILRTEMYM